MILLNTDRQLGITGVEHKEIAKNHWYSTQRDSRESLVFDTQMAWNYCIEYTGDWETLG